jgi:hypothetical protein
MRNLMWIMLFVLAFGLVARWVIAEPVLELRRATAAVDEIEPDQATGGIRLSGRPERAFPAE